MNTMSTSQRRIAVLALVLLVAILVLSILLSSISRAGRTEVEFVTVPSDSRVTIDGDSFKPGKRFVTPGEYEVTVSRDGFESSTRTIEVGLEPASFGFVLGGESDTAKRYFEDNPDEVIKTEAIGGIESGEQGKRIVSKWPVATLVPYTDPNWLYSIDYGVNQDDPEDIFLLINKSSTEGRANAIKWIKNKGFNPSELDIRYDDYTSPLLDRKKSERSY